MVARPMVPVYSISKTLMFPLEVESIQVRVVTCAVPPGSFKSGSTVVSPSIIILVHCTELGSFLR